MNNESVVIRNHNNVVTEIKRDIFSVAKSNDIPNAVELTMFDNNAIEEINKRTKIISAFPGCGKTYFFKNRKELKTCDSDSSNFSWIKDENGNNTDRRNPDFPNNYIDNIISNVGKYDIIFVSSHDTVRKALHDNNIPFILMYPDKSMKDDFIKRYKDRNNDNKFIEFMNNNFNKFIDDIEQHEKNTHKIKLNKYNKYVSDNFMQYDDIAITPIELMYLLMKDTE